VGLMVKPKILNTTLACEVWKGTREAPPRLPDRRNATKEVADVRQQRTYRGGASNPPPSPAKSCKATHRNTSRQALPAIHLTRSGSGQGLEEKAAEMDRSDPGGPRDHVAGAFKKAADEIRKYYQTIISGKQALVTTLQATQEQILSQYPTDATRFWWHLYGS